MKMSKASDKEWQALVDYFNSMENRDEAVPQWRRVVFGFRVVVDNACDPNADTLEFKPEICEAMAERDQLKAEVERLKGADESAAQAAFELQCHTMNERDAWHDMARELADCIITGNNHGYGLRIGDEALARFNAAEKVQP